MSTTDPDKLFFIKAYFDALSALIENLKKLNSVQIDGQSFRDEALILCLVYIDGLASSYYGGDSTKEHFCKALRELSGNSVFGKLHVKNLLDPENDKRWPGLSEQFLSFAFLTNGPERPQESSRRGASRMLFYDFE